MSTDGWVRRLGQRFDVSEGGEFFGSFGRFGETIYERVLFWSEFLVSEPDVAELDAVGSIAGARMAGTGDFGGGVEQLEDAFAGSHRSLQYVVLIAEILDGSPEALRIHVERGEHADGDRTGKHTEAAAPDHESDGDR